MFYLIRFPTIGERLPHGDTEAPYVTFTGELVEFETFWSVPLQRPFTCSTSLYMTNQQQTACQWIPKRRSAKWIKTGCCNMIFSMIRLDLDVYIYVYTN